jgi:hypothetical protein
MPRYGDKIVCGAANTLQAATHRFLRINIWSHPGVTPMVLNTPIASGVLRLCRALIPARLRNHDQQNEQGIEDARHGEDQEDRNRGAALAVGIEYPAAAHDRGNDCEQAELQAHVERRHRTVGQADHEEVDDDKPDQHVDAEESADEHQAVQ